MATQADFGWELPDLSDVADGPDAFLQFADDIAATVKDRGITSYTPSWVADGPLQTSNPSVRRGSYRIDNGVCTFVAYLEFGANTAGGSGGLSIGVPVPANTGVGSQQVSSVLWTPAASAMWYGPAFIDAITNWQRARPYFPVNNTRPDMLPWASWGGFLGLSIPTIPANPGSYSVMNGGFIHVQGTYFVA